jgi:hypothetical protein
MVTDLWAVYVAGPDDVIAAPSKAEAEAEAQRLNDWFPTLQRGPLSPTLHATVVPWPYSPEGHAADLTEWAS